MLKILKKQGFSFVELIVTSVILVISFVCILTTISSLQPQEQISSRKLEAALFAKSLASELRSQVDASTWDTGNLAVNVPGSPHILNNPPAGWDVRWDVTDVNAFLRQIVFTITYPD